MNFLPLQYQSNREWYDYVFNSTFGVIILTFFILYWVLKVKKIEFHSHWNSLIPGFKYSSRDFYSSLKSELLSKDINGISTTFTSLKEGGVMSSSRLYLRVEWKNYQYDMCCAPFGDGLFLSWWLVYKTSLGQVIISRIPFIGGWLERRIYRLTYYKIDTASMFMTYCHNAMLKIADEITKDTGIRIKDDNRKPILKDIFNR